MHFKCNAHTIIAIWIMFTGNIQSRKRNIKLHRGQDGQWVVPSVDWGSHLDSYVLLD